MRIMMLSYFPIQRIMIVVVIGGDYFPRRYKDIAHLKFSPFRWTDQSYFGRYTNLQYHKIGISKPRVCICHRQSYFISSTSIEFDHWIRIRGFAICSFFHSIAKIPMIRERIIFRIITIGCIELNRYRWFRIRIDHFISSSICCCDVTFGNGNWRTIGTTHIANTSYIPTPFTYRIIQWIFCSRRIIDRRDVLYW